MLRLTGVSKAYGAIKVLEAVSLEVPAGHALCVLGPSGCGKTTLLKVMALITLPDQGFVIIKGTDTTRMSDSTRARVRATIAYSFQEPLLLPYLNAWENTVSIVAFARGLPVSALRSKAAELFSGLGLADRTHHPPAKLSVGEKKRVDIARALLKEPSMLVADEPFGSLDPETGRLVMERLNEYMDQGGTLIYSAVNPSESSWAHHRFLMMKPSSLAQKGRVDSPLTQVKRAGSWQTVDDGVETHQCAQCPFDRSKLANPLRWRVFLP